MASQTTSTETRAQLETLIKRWGVRWRMRQLSLYTPRILSAVLVVGMVVSMGIAILRLMPTGDMLIVTGVAMGVTGTLLAGSIGLLGKSGDEAARQFDEIFELQERMSTALEILDGRIKTSSQITQRQLQDTYKHAQNIDPKKQMPFKFDRLAWGVFAILIIPFLIVVIFAAIMTFNVGQPSTGEATQQAIADAADTTRDITSEVATDSALSDEERTALLESAEQTLAELENPEASAEDAFVALEELQSDLREQADAMNEQAQSSQASLSQASQALSDNTAQQTGSGADNLSNQLSDIGDTVENMSEAERAELQQRLEEAAEATAEENPALSQDLFDAAMQLDMGNLGGAQQSLEDAAQQAEAANQQNQNQQNSAQNLEEQANAAQEAAGDVATSEFNENAQTEGQIDNTAQGLEEAGADVSQLQMEDPAAGAGASNQNQPPAEGESGRAVESDNPDAQSANTSGQSDSDSGDPSEAEGASEESGEGSGAGDSDAQQDSQDIAGGGEIPASNASSSNDDGGEQTFEEIFAPTDLDQDRGNTTVELEAEGDNTASIEGEFDENPTGGSAVPYNEIFTSYANEANSALENGYVPLGVRDVVRDYFTSIEPTGNQATDD